MTAKDQAYAFTKQRILGGEYPGGDLITEGEVAGAVGVSRTPVREAFLRLESEGLLRLYPKRGALVVPVSAAEIEQVIETRLVIERFAVEKVTAQKIDLSAPLLDAVRDHGRLLRAKDYDAFAAADRDFHARIVAAAGNDIITGLYETLRDRQLRMGVRQALDPARARRVLAEHRRIAEAVAAGDRRAARQAVEEHLANARTAIH